MKYIALITIASYLSASPMSDIHCSFEISGPVHSQSQYGPIVQGPSLTIKAIIDEDVYTYVDARGRTHLTGKKGKTHV